MRAILAVCALIAMSLPAGTQPSCDSVNSQTAYETGSGRLDPEQVYRQLGASDAWVARANWLAVTGSPPNSRASCFAGCTEAYDGTLSLCMRVNGAPEPDEPASVSMARNNCFEAARQQHLKCLAPAQIMSCTP